MDKVHRDCSIRIVVGLFINLGMVIPVFSAIQGGHRGFLAPGLEFELALIGGARGQLKGNRHIKFPDETPMNNLLLTMLGKANVPTPEILGDSTSKVLAEV